MGECSHGMCVGYKARLGDKWARVADWGRVGRPIREADEIRAARRRSTATTQGKDCG